MPEKLRQKLRKLLPPRINGASKRPLTSTALPLRLALDPSGGEPSPSSTQYAGHWRKDTDTSATNTHAASVTEDQPPNAITLTGDLSSETWQNSTLQTSVAGLTRGHEATPLVPSTASPSADEQAAEAMGHSLSGRVVPEDNAVHTPHTHPRSRDTPSSRSSDPLTAGPMVRSAVTVAESTDPRSPESVHARILDEVIGEIGKDTWRSLGINEDFRNVTVAAYEAMHAVQIAKNRLEESQWEIYFGTKGVVLRRQAEVMIKHVERFIKLGDDISQSSVHLKIPWAAIKTGLNLTISEAREMKIIFDGITLATYVASHLQIYVGYLISLPEREEATSLFRYVLVKLYAKLLSFMACAVKTMKQRTIIRGIQAWWGVDSLSNFKIECDQLLALLRGQQAQCAILLDYSRWGRLSQILDDRLHSLHDFEATLNDINTKTDNLIIGQERLLLDAHRSGARLDRIETTLSAQEIDRHLDKLRRSVGADRRDFDNRKAPLCFPGTREEILASIGTWVTEPATDTIYWLCGMAGTGKSTICRTVAQASGMPNVLSTSFFFKRGAGDRSSALLFFSTIARQLAYIGTYPDLKLAIAQALAEDPDLSSRNLGEQFTKLIYEPLKRAGPQLTLLLVAIDALDECEDSQDAETILRYLRELVEIPQLTIRIFITSRPCNHLNQNFQKLTNRLKEVILDDIQKATIDEDLRIYFHACLSQLPLPVLHQAWPSTDYIIPAITEGFELWFETAV